MFDKFLHHLRKFFLQCFYYLPYLWKHNNLLYPNQHLNVFSIGKFSFSLVYLNQVHKLRLTCKFISVVICYFIYSIEAWFLNQGPYLKLFQLEQWTLQLNVRSLFFHYFQLFQVFFKFCFSWWFSALNRSILNEINFKPIQVLKVEDASLIDQVHIFCRSTEWPLLNYQENIWNWWNGTWNYLSCWKWYFGQDSLEFSLFELSFSFHLLHRLLLNCFHLFYLHPRVCFRMFFPTWNLKLC